ncbi:hypothetical protein CQA57_04415 [Helicobacter anseris]|uniref:DUF4325 domain-containing protein n=1 Tax=Helicobacter anseris TaxID=375926 RepID=A0A3D8JAL4_9HELI|nr:STAS-like domain-containing protein [Helicobacter anseris]RDU73914.1 hypothetical protein CQA57_04415 [Helicobacter anseris]
MSKLKYDFAKEFTDTPGPRYKKLGSFSGEEFREILRDLLKRYEKIEIDGSGIRSSFSPSFLSEAFSPLCQEMGEEYFFDRVSLISSKNPKLKEKFEFYSKNLQ